MNLTSDASRAFELALPAPAGTPCLTFDSAVIPGEIYKRKRRRKTKPPHTTLLRRRTAKSLAYLEREGLAIFTDCKLAVAKKLMRKLPDGSIVVVNAPTYGV